MLKFSSNSWQLMGASLPKSLDQVVQFQAQLLRGPEERILGGLFRGPAYLADGFELHSLKVAQLEHHSLAGGKPRKRFFNPLADLARPRLALRVAPGALFGNRL